MLNFQGKITWEKKSDIEGVEIDPTAVTVNEDGIILVGDGCNHRVLLFQPGALEYFWFQVSFLNSSHDFLGTLRIKVSKSYKQC